MKGGPSSPPVRGRSRFSGTMRTCQTKLRLLMRSALLQSELVRLYAIDEVRVMRREMVLYAGMHPPGPQRNQHRQTALSLRSLLKNKDWLDIHTIEGSSHARGIAFSLGR
jgi:hypothetical protein